MAIRYSGDAVIRISYDDRGYYNTSVSAHGHTWKGKIYPPTSGYGRGVSYDSPKAYDEVANAALNFADDEVGSIENVAAFDRLGRGLHISRTKANRWG